MSKKQSDLESYINAKFPNRPKRRRVFSDTVGESMTHQSFKDECDINNIIRTWERTGLDPSRADKTPRYGDFSDMSDYHEALNLVSDVNNAFADLPADLREKFANDPAELLAFVNNPDNEEEAISLGILSKNPHKEDLFDELEKISTPPAAPSEGKSLINNDNSAYGPPI